MKSQMGGGAWCEWGGMPPHSYANGYTLEGEGTSHPLTPRNYKNITGFNLDVDVLYVVCQSLRSYITIRGHGFQPSKQWTTPPSSGIGSGYASGLSTYYINVPVYDNGLGTKEGNVLFNDALNTVIYSHMVSDIW